LIEEEKRGKDIAPSEASSEDNEDKESTDSGEEDSAQVKVTRQFVQTKCYILMKLQIYTRATKGKCSSVFNLRGIFLVFGGMTTIRSCKLGLRRM
jgi:hypothetical protein